MDLSANDILGFCRSREVELVFATPQPPSTLRLHGQYEGYGDFFSIQAFGVRYVQITSGVVVADLVFERSLRNLLGRFERWRWLAEEFIESALVITEVEETLPSPSDYSKQGIIVAETISFVAGRDWR